VADTGFNLNPKFALAATLMAAPIAWTGLQWAAYSTQQGGEIKGARVFKNQVFIIVGSLITVGCILAIMAWVEQRAVGTSFFNAVSASYYGGYSQSGNGIGSVLPFPGLYAMVVSPNPIIVVLVALGFVFGTLQITCNCFIGMTRIMVGMSLDRLLPRWVSKVNARFHTPVNAHLVYLAFGVAVTLGYNYVASWYNLTLGVTFAAGYVFVVSMLAAALLPYRAKELYLSSPGSQYTIGGVPWVTVLGAIGFFFAAAAEIAFLASPGYGLRGTTPYLVVSGVVVGSIVVYWITHFYQRGKGVNISYAFREVPPE
jgi:basic amino acid/polyamine antiporter, APA family